MRRWLFATLGVLFVASVIGARVARAVGFRSPRVSSLVSVLSQWLAAYALWSLAGSLALRYELLAVYDPNLYALLALIGGICHYRTQVTAGRERGRIVFVGGQIVWLVVLLFQNGAFTN